MSYYAMFHSVNALLRKIGVKTGKQYAHEITTTLLLHYFYYTGVIEDELLKIYENAEEKAKGLVVSYIFAKEERTMDDKAIEAFSSRVSTPTPTDPTASARKLKISKKNSEKGKVEKRDKEGNREVLLDSVSRRIGEAYGLDSIGQINGYTYGFGINEQDNSVFISANGYLVEYDTVQDLVIPVGQSQSQIKKIDVRGRNIYGTLENEIVGISKDEN